MINHKVGLIGGGNTLTDAGRGFVAIGVRRRNVDEPGDPRLEQRPVRAHAGGAHRRQRHAVIAPLSRDDLRLIGLAAQFPIRSRDLDA